nr:MAG TPA: hypothetical protein [Caudoviricetes sp.]
MVTVLPELVCVNVAVAVLSTPVLAVAVNRLLTESHVSQDGSVLVREYATLAVVPLVFTVDTKLNAALSPPSLVITPLDEAPPSTVKV